MKRLVLFILLFVSVAAIANDSIPAIIQDMQSHVKVTQSKEISDIMMDLINGVEHEQVQIQGYRVQVYSSNSQQTAKNDAYAVEQMLNEREIGSPIYVVFNPPFWKVRIGDFRSQEEAQKMKAFVMEKCPELATDTYVVRDMILIVE